MPAIGAGLLLYRRTDDPETGERRLEVLLVHPGGPYWAKKDAGAWSIPKGEAEPEELGPGPAAPPEPWRRPPKPKPRLAAIAADLLAVAAREFREETGFEPGDVAAPGAAHVSLGGVKQRAHKLIYAWALEGDCDAGAITSGTFAMEWPPRSGERAEFPEVDRAAWFDVAAAREAIVPAQRRFIDDLEVVAAAGA